MFAKQDTCDQTSLLSNDFTSVLGRKNTHKKLVPLATPIGSMWYIDLHLIDFHGKLVCESTIVP